MYLQFNLTIDDIINVFKDTDKDLISLQLQAIKDTGHADAFEEDFVNLRVREGDIINFAVNAIPAWLAENDFHDANELIIKRIKQDLNSKYGVFNSPQASRKKQAE